MKFTLVGSLALLSASLFVAGCGDEQGDFEPSEEEIQNALNRLSDEYATQDPILCECSFAQLGYTDAAACETDRAVTAEESSCILEAFVLNRGRAGDWLTCQINTERAFSTCIASLTCESSFDACNAAQDTDSAECPTLTSALDAAWTSCQ